MHVEQLEVGDLWAYPKNPAVTLKRIGRIGCIIGRNNSGKSRLLHALKMLLDKGGGDAADLAMVFPPTDLHHNSDTRPMPSARVVLKYKQVEVHSLAQASGDDGLINRLQEWVPNSDVRITIQFVPNPAPKQVGSGTVNRRCEFLTPRDGADAPSVRELEAWFVNSARSRFRTDLLHLDSWRSLPAGTPRGELSYFKVLFDWNTAQAADREAHQRFERVENLFQKLTGLELARLRPTSDPMGLNVDVTGKAGSALPIAHFGDGIKHLLIFAIEVARKSARVILFEEPETGLHPLSQRELIRFIRSEIATSPAHALQVIMTTHSSVFLDDGPSKSSEQSDDLSVFHVSQNAGRSTVSPVQTLASARLILDELGIHPSDLLQANTAVWVEGPSDAFFIQRCLHLLAPNLRAGIDFQFIHYGGALRGYLTLGEDAAGMVNLLRLSRRAAVISDSDRQQPGDHLSDDKQRIERECKESGALSWITPGRTIENSIPVDALGLALTRLLDRPVTGAIIEPFEPFDDVLSRAIGEAPHGAKWLLDHGKHKARFMREVCVDLNESDLAGDLRSFVLALASHIRGPIS